MKTGYEDFFKKARQASANPDAPRAKVRPQPRSAPSPSPFSSQESRDEKVAQMMRMTKRPKRPVRKTNWRLASFSLIGIVVAAVGMVYIDQVEAFFKKVEIRMLGIASAEEPASKDKKEAPKADATPVAAATAVPLQREFTQDEINHFVKLNERKRELDAREEELGRQETEFQSQKAELERRLHELEQTRKQISSVLEERVKGDDQKVETLVQMYSNMKPVQAAKVFETMDEDLAVEIIGRMKKKNSAEIMNLIKPEKAQLFSEKFAGYKRAASSTRTPAEGTKNNTTKEGGI